MGDTRPTQHECCGMRWQLAGGFRFCAKCGKPFPVPASELTEEDRLALECENAGRATRGWDSLPSWDGYPVVRKWALASLARARELLVPAAEAKGRREAFEQCLERTNVEESDLSYIMWMRQQRDACGPAKAEVAAGSSPSECEKWKGLYELKVARREEWRDKAIASNEASRIARAESDLLKQERDDLSAKLAEAEKREAQLQEHRWQLNRMIESEFGRYGESWCEDAAIRILRAQKAKIERMTRELAEASKDLARIRDLAAKSTAPAHRESMPCELEELLFPGTDRLTYASVTYATEPATQPAHDGDFDVQAGGQALTVAEAISRYGTPAPAPVMTALESIVAYGSGAVQLDKRVPSVWLYAPDVNTAAALDQVAAVKGATEPLQKRIAELEAMQEDLAKAAAAYKLQYETSLDGVFKRMCETSKAGAK